MPLCSSNWLTAIPSHPLGRVRSGLLLPSAPVPCAEGSGQQRAKGELVGIIGVLRLRSVARRGERPHFAQDDTKSKRGPRPISSQLTTIHYPLATLLLLPQPSRLRQQRHAVHQVLHGDDAHQSLLVHYGNHAQSASAQLAKSRGEGISALRN